MLNIPDLLKKHLGVGSGEWVWLRSEETQIQKDRWHALSLFGLEGSMSFSSKKDVEFSYSVTGPNVTVKSGGHDYVLKNFLTKVYDKNEITCGSVIDILTCIDLCWDTWGAMGGLSHVVWPSMDLTLPQQISATYEVKDDSVVLKFTPFGRPSVVIEGIMTYNLDIVEMIVKAKQITLKYAGSMIKKSDTFNL